jgi:transposase
MQGSLSSHLVYKQKLNPKNQRRLEMKKTQRTLRADNSTKEHVLQLAFELSLNKWKLAFGHNAKMRMVTIDARDLDQIQQAIEKAKKRFKLDGETRILSCYEAGRDGFWLHRYLLSCGIDNLVVDSSSIEVNRRKRRAKTDRIDAKKLLAMLIRYNGGERGMWSVVNVPGVEAEDGRHLHRELDVLKKERKMHRSRIKSLLFQHGIAVKNPSSRRFLIQLETFRNWEGKALPLDLKARLIREHARLRTVEEQIYGLKKEQEQRIERCDSTSLKKVAQLMELRGIGLTSSWKFVMEFFGWREFKNDKQIGTLAGLTPTPYDSGGYRREQGIGKDGNKRVRTLAVEMAWVWIRFQPKSNLAQWYLQRFEGGGSRTRRIGIVAVARRLLIDLWRFLEFGVIPEGASLKPVVR